MKFRTLLFFLLLSSTVMLATSQDKYSMIRVFVPSKSTLDLIWSSGIDFEGSSGKIGGWMEFVAGKEEQSRLTAKGIQFEITIDDLSKYYSQRNALIPFKADGFHYGSMGGFYTYSEVVQQLDSMRLLYTNLITVKTSIGKSIENGDLWAVKISSNADIDDPNKPEVLYTALHHAREPEGMMTLMYYMWWLLENYGTNIEATYLVNNRQMWFIPVVNADGYVYNQTTNPSGGGMWRKNRRNNGGGIYGVDLNRNYGTYDMWNSPNGGSSSDPSNETYRGTAPFSEPEIHAIDSLMRAHNFKTCLNYHTYGNYLVYPWGYLSRENGDSLIYRDWAYGMTFDNHYTNGTDQQTVSYSTRGNSDDYMYGDNTKPITYAMTPEVGTTGFWPSMPEIFPLVQQNLRQNLLLAYFSGPYPNIQSYQIQDEDGNGFMDRGENFNFAVSIKNKGLTQASSLTISVSTNTTAIQFPTSSIVLHNLPAQATQQVSFAGHVLGPIITGVPFELYVDFSDPQGLSKRDTVNLFLGSPTVVFVDSASNGIGNWNTGEGWGLTSNAHTVPKAFTDSPSGNYAANANNSLTTVKPINLNGYQYAQLRFWTKWATEPTWDFATVEVSSNNGSTWTALRSKLSHTGSGRASSQPAGTWGYESYTPGLTWVEQDIDLSSYVGNQIKLRFRIASDGGDQRDGFYVDDIRVLGYNVSADTTAAAQPILAFPPNNSLNQLTNLVLRWYPSDGATSYHLQFSNDPFFNLRIVDDSTITDTSKQLGSLTLGTTYYWRVRAKKPAGNSEWSSPVWNFTTSTTIFSFQVSDRWNIISLPISVADPTKSVLFPTATSDAFSYSPGTGYSKKDSILNNLGFWLKFPGTQRMDLSGTTRLTDTIGVIAGWNLIGSISSKVPVNTVNQIPPGIIQSDFFGYSYGYTLRDTIEPGKGYWVKVSHEGKLVLSTSFISKNEQQKPSYFFDSFNALTIADNSGSKSFLYFSSDSDNSHLERYELPPKPPAGTFDARFETQRMATSLRSQDNSSHEERIVLQSAAYPVTVNWKLIDDQSRFELVEISDGMLIKKIHKMAGAGNLQVTDPSVISLLLRLEETVATLPSDFSVKQNFPNPFNPSTIIEFDLPMPSIVSLKIYNILGQEVRVVLNEQNYPGGHFFSRLDAADMNAGVYFYKFTAKSINGDKTTQSTNKMVLLK